MICVIDIPDAIHYKIKYGYDLEEIEIRKVISAIKHEIRMEVFVDEQSNDFRYRSKGI